MSAETSAAPAPAWMIGTLILVAAAVAWLEPTTQDAIVPAMVLSGIIHVRPDSLMGQYFYGVWTLVNQSGAFLFWLGLPQAYVNFAYNFAIVGASLVGYAMIVYGFSAKPLFALAAALFCFSTGFLVHLFVSPDYSAGWIRWDTPDRYSYGAAAYAGTTLAIGALAGGRNVVAGFVSAALIAIHPVVGTFMTGTLFVGVLLCRFVMPSVDTAGIAKGFARGLIVVAISLMGFLWMRPTPGATVDAAAYHAYLAFWEYHRARPFVPDALVWVLVAAIAVGSALIFPAKRNGAGRLAAAVTFSAVIASGILYVAFYAFRNSAPQFFVAAMPSRLLSVHAAIAGPFALGIVVSLYQRFVAGRTVSVAPSRRIGFRALPWGALVGLAIFIPPTFGRTVSAVNDALAKRLHYGLPSYDDPFWAAVRKAHITEPVLASDDASRPALVDGHLSVVLDATAFDFVPYLPFTAHDLARIIEKGYGISFDSPPDRHVDVLPANTGRDYWKGLTPDQWASLARSLGFGAVLAPSDWRIDLPAIAKGPDFSLYRVPEHDEVQR